MSDKAGALRRHEPPEPAHHVEPGDQFYAGFAAALAMLQRYGDASAMRHIMTSSGITLKHLEQAEVYEFDLDAIRRGFAP